jgi:hypothetical protein
MAIATSSAIEKANVIYLIIRAFSSSALLCTSASGDVVNNIFKYSKLLINHSLQIKNQLPKAAYDQKYAR